MPPAPGISPMSVYRSRHRVRPAITRRLKRARRALGIHRIPLTANERRLAELRDRHAGQRAFLIGNGPSLRVEDLDRLRDEVTFASNKIYLAFDRTAWRPSYYIVADLLVAEQNAERIDALPLTKLFGLSCRRYFSRRSGVVWLNELSADTGASAASLFSADAMYGVHGGYTVLFLQLQLAYYMGVTEAYLLGVDFDFACPPPTGEVCEHGPVLVGQGEVNHFHPEYRRVGERWTVPRLDLQRRAFLAAREAYEAAGRKVLNASRQTRLDVFDRVDLDRVLDQP